MTTATTIEIHERTRLSQTRLECRGSQQSKKSFSHDLLILQQQEPLNFSSAQIEDYCETALNR